MIYCKICKAHILSHARFMKCYLCQSLYHIQCISVSYEDSVYCDRHVQQWMCFECVSDNLPFTNIEDETEYYATITCNQDRFTIDVLENMLFDPFESNDDTNIRPWTDIDPDLQFFNDMTFIDPSITCNYYTQENFNDFIQKNDISLDSFSVLHLNIRSLPKNSTNFSCLLDGINLKFSVIGLSETWLSSNNYDLYNVENYNCEHSYRQTRVGGGVSILIKNTISYQVRYDLNNFSDLLESLFIEITRKEVDTDKDIIVGVLYRPPNTDIREFNFLFFELLSKFSSKNKMIYLLGDFNINLLKGYVE